MQTPRDTGPGAPQGIPAPDPLAVLVQQAGFVDGLDRARASSVMADSPDFRLLEQHADVWHLWVETVLGGGQSQGDAQRFSESRSRALGALTLAAGEVREVRKGSRWALFGAAAVFGLIAGAGAFGGFVAHANITAQAAPEPVAAAATPDDTAALEARIEELATGLSELQFRFDHLAETAYPILGHGYITTDDE